jgi:nicotinamide-nucleotide amidase
MIRKAVMSDLEEILEIYSRARVFMSQTGNPTQWKNNYPDRDTVVNDIVSQNLYVIEEDGNLDAVFMLSEGPDETYADIDGEWINDEPYHVIHRVASSGRKRGVMPMCLDFALLSSQNVRIDTHNDNLVMQHQLEKLGFKRCGIIKLKNGEPRIAYQFVAEYRVVEQLISKGWHISFAESCTGGLASARIVNVPDASKVLDASVVTYANDAKINYLGVSSDTIESFGVVSENVASEMARGIAKANNAEVGVGITGIAGPGGATATKPVGMVCFGFYVNGEVCTSTVYFGAVERNNVRRKSVDFVYNKLLKLLKKC